jgi:transposase-like protein
MSKKNNFYSKELKLKAVSMYLNEGYSYRYIMKELGVKSDSQIRDWVKYFNEKGESAFDEETRGRLKGINKGRRKKNFNSLEEEVKFLRMENDFLKKLRALQRNPKKGIII